MLNPKNVSNGSEQHEAFTTRVGRKSVKRVQYDYRAANGELFSTVKSTLKECQAAKDSWLKSKGWER